jgi:hypothetical protein
VDLRYSIYAETEMYREKSVRDGDTDGQGRERRKVGMASGPAGESDAR